MPTSGVLLLIVERGAKLPSWLASCQDKVNDTVVLVAASDESPSHFATRAMQRMQALRDTGQRIQSAVVIPADHVVPPEVLVCRLQIAQSILQHLALHNRGRLLLLTSRSLRPDAQLELLNLAGTLSERLHGTKLTVALHFGAASDAEPPRELLEAPPSSQRSSGQRRSHHHHPPASTHPTDSQENELVSAVVQKTDSETPPHAVESTG